MFKKQREKAIVPWEGVFLITLFYILISFSGFSQSFEGLIKYRSESLTDTAYLTYNILNKLVRIDEADHSGSVQKSTIVNLQNKSITAIDPNKRLYTDLYPKPHSLSSATDLEINRTNNTKVINGYECQQWRVKIRSANTEVAYWVALVDFAFYDDILKSIPLTDNTLTFFLSIPNSEGYLPLHVCERTLLRDVKNTFSVMEINKQVMDKSIFEIPAGYEEFHVSR